ncbi:uncharacterized protein [Gossypium hirsutum]|uniref:Uncharacterized protein n=1 Tax=Gossypium hirsutum TaxID=3635 RepID=A0ABM3BJ36_GOSHI|nr:uncharacterized protein LOC121228029 [Gossypium hirsutum]
MPQGAPVAQWQQRARHAERKWVRFQGKAAYVCVQKVAEESLVQWPTAGCGTQGQEELVLGVGKYWKRSSSNRSHGGIKAVDQGAVGRRTSKRLDLDLLLFATKVHGRFCQAIIVKQVIPNVSGSVLRETRRWPYDYLDSNSVLNSNLGFKFCNKASLDFVLVWGFLVVTFIVCFK